MTMDFSKADRQKDFSVLIPQGTLAFGHIKIKPFNADAGLWETPSKPPKESKFLNCEIHISGGQHDKRVVFTRLGTAGSEAYINMGKAAIRAILEVGKQASEQNVAGYAIESYGDLNGLQVAIKVKEEPEQNGYAPKNDVAVFLSPVDPVTQKDFERLVAGDTEPKGKQAVRSGSGGAAPAQAAPAARWAQGAGAGAGTAAPAQPAVNPAQAPAWLAPQNPQPAQTTGDAPQQPASQPAETTPDQPTAQPMPQGSATPPWVTGPAQN